MALVLVLVALAIAVAFSGGSADARRSGAASVAGVTLQVDRYYDTTYSRYRLRFAGAISPARPDEYITVVAQRCGSSVATAVDGAVTRADGTWEGTYQGFAYGGTATYRARWNDEASSPITLRGALQPQISKRAGGRYLLWMTADSALGGNVVELQRFAADRWVRVRRATLNVVADLGHTSYTATFTVRKRGLTLRVAVPAKTAGRCFGPAVSQTFRS